MTDTVPPPSAQLATLIRITWLRLVRGKAVWVCASIALAPVLVGFGMRTLPSAAKVVDLVAFLVMTLVSSVLVSASIGEEIEDRTTTYLWSRPLPRWVMIVGKLVALAPVSVGLITGGWIAAIVLATGAPPSAHSTIALATGAVVISTMTAGIATLVPRHGMALAIAYMVILDAPIGAIPASLQSISVTRQIRLMSGLDDPPVIVAPAITMAIIAGLWLAVGLWRVRRLES